MSYDVLALNLDGINGLDLVKSSGTSVDISVFLSEGGGAFEPALGFSSGTGSRIWGLASADVDGINGPDILTANENSDNFTVLLNDGTGRNFTAHSLASGDGASFVAAADVDGINGPDAIVTNRFADTVSVALNNGIGAPFPPYLSTTNYSVPGTPLEVEMADINRDSWPDIVTATANNDSVSILLNNGDGTFDTPVTFPAGNRAWGVAVGDINNDKWIDVVTGNWAEPDPENVTVLINTAGKPDAFSFTDQTDVALSSEVISDSITVTNLVLDTDISVVDGEYSINGGAFTSVDGMVGNGDMVRVRHISSDAYLTSTETTLTIGGVEDTYTATTLADTEPDAFMFVDQTVVPLSTQITSDTLTIVGLGASSPVSISGGAGEYSVNGGAFTSGAGFINNNDQVRVRLTSSGAYNNLVSTTLDIGGISDSFEVTTRLSTTPDAFTFVDQTDVPRNTVQESNLVTVSGLGTSSTVSISGGEYSLNSGAFTSGVSAVDNGDTIQVRHTAASSYGASVNTQLTIGEYSDTFTSTTEPNLTPAPFIFTPQVGVPLNQIIVSNTITISGLGATSMVSVIGGEYSLNSGGFSAEVSAVNNGDTLQVRHTSSSANSTETVTTVSVGNFSTGFSTTTEEPALPLDQNSSNKGDDSVYKEVRAVVVTWMAAVGYAGTEKGSLPYWFLLVLLVTSFCNYFRKCF